MASASRARTPLGTARRLNVSTSSAPTSTAPGSPRVTSSQGSINNNQNHSSQGSENCHVQVAVRCRPWNDAERKTGEAGAVVCDPSTKQVRVMRGTSKQAARTIDFDQVFGMYSRQDEVFDAVAAPLVETALKGFSCTVFAYGPTGTGKTHTMEGNLDDPELWGLVPRAAEAIFNSSAAQRGEVTVRISYLEIYNEELQDLLSMGGDKRLKLLEDARRGVVCHNLDEFIVANMEDVMSQLRRGCQTRQTAATLSNQKSSRSHAIFTFRIVLRTQSDTGEDVIRNGQVNLVDLAGSECVGRSGAREERAREAGSINQSLLALGRVITALADQHPHIPFRDSKLTRILQDSLSGKSRTSIIATLSPSFQVIEDTLSTLEYAHRARSIRTVPQANSQVQTKVLVKEYVEEIQALRLQLQGQRDRDGVHLTVAQFEALQSGKAQQESLLMECEATLRVREATIASLKSEKETFEEELKTAKLELKSLRERLDTSERRLAEAELDLTVVKGELEQSRTEVIRLESQVSDLLSKITELETKIFQLETRVNLLENKVEQLMEDVSSLKENLNETYTDLLVASNIIEEQQLTDINLRQSISSLQSQVSHRETEVNSLFSKVAIHREAEEKRLSATSAFVADGKKHLNRLTECLSLVNEGITKDNDDIGLSTESLSMDIHRLRSLLSDSVATMSNIISSQILDWEKENESMVVDEIESRKTFVTSLSNKLQDLESSMSLGLTSLSSRLDTVLQSTQNAREKISDASSVANKLSADFVDQAASFVESQEKNSQIMLSEMDSMGSTVQSLMSRLEEGAQRRVTAAQQALAEQAQQLEVAVSQMVSTMVKSGQESLSALLEETQKVTSTANTQVQTTVGLLRDRQVESLQATVDRTAQWKRQTSSCSRLCIAHGEDAKCDLGIVSQQVREAKETLSQLNAEVSTGLSNGRDLLTKDNLATSSRMKIWREVNITTSTKNIQVLNQFVDNHGSTLSGKSESMDLLVSSIRQQIQSCKERVLQKLSEEKDISKSRLVAVNEYESSVQQLRVVRRGSTPERFVPSSYIEIPAKVDSRILRRKLSLNQSFQPAVLPTPTPLRTITPSSVAVSSVSETPSIEATIHPTSLST